MREQSICLPDDTADTISNVSSVQMSVHSDWTAASEQVGKKCLFYFYVCLINAGVWPKRNERRRGPVKRFFYPSNMCHHNLTITTDNLYNKITL